MKRLVLFDNPSFILLVGLLLFSNADCFAEEVYVKPRISLRTEYDTNKRLSLPTGNTDLDRSSYGVLTQGGLLFGVKAEKYQIELDNSVSINRYVTDLDLDSDDVNIDFSSNYIFSERVSIGLNADYQRDTTLTGELEVTGLVQDNVIRDQFSLTPNWSYVLDETSTVFASYSHREVDYEESQVNTFFDYTTDYFSLGYNNQLTSDFSGNINFSTLLFEVPDANRDTLEFTLNVGFSYQPFETWSTSFSVGGRFNETEITSNFPTGPSTFVSITSSSETVGYVMSANVDKELENGTIGLAYSRSTSAQGNGRLELLERFSVSYRQEIAETIRFSLNGGVNLTTSSGSEQSNRDRTYYFVRPNLLWTIDQNIKLNAGYQYRLQEFQNDREDAESNSFFVNFRYFWDQFDTQF